MNTKQPEPILQTASLEWRDGMPYSKKFGDMYFLNDEGLAESRYVFLKHNQLSQRFERFIEAREASGDIIAPQKPNFFSHKESFRIAETGFGSGLNFALTLQLWLEKLSVSIDDQGKVNDEKASVARKNSQLHYISFEKYPMQLEDLSRVLNRYHALIPLAKLIEKSYPSLLPGWHEIYLLDGLVRLTLWFGDAVKGLAECDAKAKVDAWFLDGFTPSRNPQMWGAKLYQQMARLSAEGTSFATFTAAGEVRRGLECVGFEVQKAKGFGRKREMCLGRLTNLRPSSSKTPWFDRNCDDLMSNVLKVPDKGRCAVVIGAGLAGATTAYALANSGWQVTVVEERDECATEASGNLAGTLHPLITVDWNLRSAFYQLGYGATLRWLQPWLLQDKVMGELSGMVQLAVNDTSRNRLQEALQRVPLPKNYAQWLEPEEAEKLLGTQVNVPAMFYPKGGWIYPRSVVKTCLQHECIDLKTSCKLMDFKRVDEGSWQLITACGEIEADTVVFATGSLSETLHAKLQLPIRPVKGQVTDFSSDRVSAAIKYPVTHEGYSSPAVNGAWVTGATFEAPDLTRTLSDEGHWHNLQTSLKAMPHWLKGLSQQEWMKNVSGRVAFRPTTPDHLPIVGAVPDWEWLEKHYCRQSHTHAVYRYPSMQYQKGLYVNNGHGPRGLMSVFLAAEILMAQIHNQALPVSHSLYAATHPARFKIRQWRSGKGC